jgi:hypothetical protein
MRSKKTLLALAEAHLNELINDDLHNYGCWDGLIDSEELTYEEYEWIRDNIKVDVNVERI